MWRASAAKSHDNGSKSESSLHAVLPDAFQDVERKVDVQITQEYNAVAVLWEETETETHMLTFGTRG